MAKDITHAITIGNVDLQLWIVTDLLKLRSLHFGYWGSSDKIAFELENIRKAQARYTEELISAIPSGVRAILDVGCGIGDNALALTARGYHVTAISPDLNHGKFFKENSQNSLRFYNQKFEDFRSDAVFDLILMSESQNYFDMGQGFQKCRRLLRCGGFVLVCGTFRKGPTAEFRQIHNVESEFIALARASGGELVESTDITNNVLPTLELLHRAFVEYLSPFIAILRNHNGAFSWKGKLAKRLFSKELRQLTNVCKYYEEFAQPDLFRTYACYKRLLFAYTDPVKRGP